MLTFYLTYLLTYALAFSLPIYYLSGIILSDLRSNIHSEILFDVPFGMFGQSFWTNNLTMLQGILFDIFSSNFSDIYLAIRSGILCDMDLTHIRTFYLAFFLAYYQAHSWKCRSHGTVSDILVLAIYKTQLLLTFYMALYLPIGLTVIQCSNLVWHFC